MKKIVKIFASIILILGLIIAIGVIGEQDRSYAEASHQNYVPKAKFIK